MEVKETKLKGCFILEPTLYEDERGYFYESFNEKKFNQLINQEIRFVQDNQAFSRKGVIRALHYQKGIYAQAKLVRVLQGTVLDVAVDLRKESPSFGKHIAVELSAENKKQLFIPRGFAHGYSVLSDTAEFFYKCDNYYNVQAEGGIMYKDPDLNIDWKIQPELIQISQKDGALPFFKEASL